MSDIPSRPQWNHEAVKTAAVAEVFEDAFRWLKARIHVVDQDKRDARAVLTLAVIESGDAYAAGRYLENFTQWPVDGELIRIIDRAYLRMPSLTAPVVHEWVMKHKMRFTPKKGQGIRFRLGDAELFGKVIAVNRREALGYVEVASRRGVLPVGAEDVLEAVPMSGNNKNGNPPTGGTPVAIAAAA